MDNDTNKPAQSDSPVFSSSEISHTKAHTSNNYFTNVQKATLGQKISAWITERRRASKEASAARQAKLRAKRAERKRAADIAAISREVPQNIPARTFMSTPGTPATNPTPAQPPATQAANVSAPVSPAPSANPPASVEVNTNTASLPATSQPTIIIDTPNNPTKKSRKKIIIAAIIAILILLIIILLLIFRPWSSPDSPEIPTPTKTQLISATGSIIELKDDAEPTGNLDMATATSFDASVLLSTVINNTTLNVYGDNLDFDGNLSVDIIADNIDQVAAINEIDDPDTLLLFEIEKARIYMIYKDYDAFFDIINTIDESALYDSQKSAFYYAMYQYYDLLNQEDPSLANATKVEEYHQKLDSVPNPPRGSSDAS